MRLRPQVRPSRLEAAHEVSGHAGGRARCPERDERFSRDVGAGGQEGSGGVPTAESGRVRHHVAGLEQHFRLDRRQVVGQRLRATTERAAVIGRDCGLQHRLAMEKGKPGERYLSTPLFAGEREATQIRRGADSYALDVLDQLETITGKLVAAIDKGKQEISRTSEASGTALPREKATLK